MLDLRPFDLHVVADRWVRADVAVTYPGSGSDDSRPTNDGVLDRGGRVNGDPALHSAAGEGGLRSRRLEIVQDDPVGLQQLAGGHYLVPAVETVSSCTTAV